MGFLIRSAFWLGLTFHAMSWGDARLADFVPTPGQTLAAGLAAQGAGGEAANAIVHGVLRGALQPGFAEKAGLALEPGLANEIGITARQEPRAKFRRASVDTLSAADRRPAWRGEALRGTL